jgi:hypothetical protein
MSSVTNQSSAALTDELNLTPNARKVLEARYLKKNEAGTCTEKPPALFRRVARTIADAELEYGANEGDRTKWEERYYKLMTSGAFMPNSPTLMNAGREMGMLSACFVLPVKDSIVDIFNSIKHTALIQKAGGGTGFAFDELRPTGDFIQSSGGTTSGPITFWKAFSEATNAIQQGAFRRGANMGMMYIHHPDILKFLHAKQNLDNFTNYNISVKVTDAWMNEFRTRSDSPHVVRNPRNGKAFVIPRDVDIWKYDIRDLVEVDWSTPVSGEGRERYFRSPELTGDIPAELQGQGLHQARDLGHHRRERLADRRARRGLHRPHQRVEPDAARRPHRGHQPMRRAAAAALRGLQPRQHQPGPVRAEPGCTPAGRGRLGRRCATRPRRRPASSTTSSTPTTTPCRRSPASARQPQDRAGRHGLRRCAVQAGRAVQQRRRRRLGRALHAKFLNDEAHHCSEKLARERGCFPNWQGSIWHTQAQPHDAERRGPRPSPPPARSASSQTAPAGSSRCSRWRSSATCCAARSRVSTPLVEVNETFRTYAERARLLLCRSWSSSIAERRHAGAHRRDPRGREADLRVCARHYTRTGT